MPFLSRRPQGARELARAHISGPWEPAAIWNHPSEWESTSTSNHPTPERKVTVVEQAGSGAGFRPKAARVRPVALGPGP